jgi:hypothetical protein
MNLDELVFIPGRRKGRATSGCIAALGTARSSRSPSSWAGRRDRVSRSAEPRTAVAGGRAVAADVERTTRRQLAQSPEHARRSRGRERARHTLGGSVSHTLSALRSAVTSMRPNARLFIPRLGGFAAPRRTGGGLRATLVGEVSWASSEPGEGDRQHSRRVRATPSRDC